MYVSAPFILRKKALLYFAKKMTGRSLTQSFFFKIAYGTTVYMRVLNHAKTIKYNAIQSL